MTRFARLPRRPLRASIARSSGKPRSARFRPLLEAVEGRVLLATFTVMNLNDAGPGSLRQALIDANAAPGPGVEVIDFMQPGIIQLTSGALPAVSRPVNIDGTSAPGFSLKQEPLVEIDAKGSGGLQFNTGSAGSALQSLAIDNSGSDAVTLNAGNILVVGNFIGVKLDGSTVYGNAGNGIVINATSTNNTIGATSTVPPNLVISHASNVISGNAGNGIAIHGSSGNTVVANYIGTDLSGLVALGNAGNGILLDSGATQNTIGGIIPFVNSNKEVPESNLISGNQGDGVLITGAETSSNSLSANFIGTDVTGSAALGNAGDGVGILDQANGNILTGTTFATLSPFIYANIVSGNLGNGIRVNNANSTVIQANFFGLGLDQKTRVGNGLDGTLIEGSSMNTMYGGVIPLGNDSSANGQNGVELRDTVSGTVVFNTFAGIAPFEDFTNLGNSADGMLVTSTGPGNTLKTNVIAENHLNGIELSGEATGLLISQDIIGLDTDGMLALPNGGDGVLVGGDAHGNTLGGFEQSVVPQLTISGNLGHGVAFTGTAHGNLVRNSAIGTDSTRRVALGNAGAGIFLGPGTSANTIGGTAAMDANVISGNLGNGIELLDTTGNLVEGNLIGTQDRRITPLLPLLNGGNGIYIEGSSNNLIGGTTAGAGNAIAYNGGAGVFVNSGTGNAILENSIYNNQSMGIVLQNGANNNQPAPRLIRFQRKRNRGVITGTLVAARNATYVIEFFANTTVIPSRAASGQIPLAPTKTVTTNNRGVALIRFNVMAEPTRSFFTATATSAANDTSVFSNPVK
jgi:hypothetical protein